MARLHDLDSARLGGYGWIGGLVVLVELRHRVVALRELLNLPPCNGLADIDEVIASTTKELQELYPGRFPLISSLPICKGEQKLIFQRLHRFYQTLCAMEKVWVESCAQKNQETTSGCLDSTAIDAQMHFQDQQTRRKKHWDFLCQKRENLLPGVSNSLFSYATRWRKSKLTNKGRKCRPVIFYSDEVSTLEQLGHKILKKLEDFSKQVRVASESSNDIRSPDSSSSQSSSSGYSPFLSSPSDRISLNVKPCLPMEFASVSPTSSDGTKGSDTPTSVLPATNRRISAPSYYINIGTASLIWPPPAAVSDKVIHSISEQKVLIEPPGTDSYAWQKTKWAANEITEQGVMHVSSGMEVADRFALQNENTAGKLEHHSTNGPIMQVNQPLEEIANSHLNMAPAVMTGKGRALPPPPPPPPPPTGLKALGPSSSTKLKRSAAMGRLYTAMKRKMEGAGFVQSRKGEIAFSDRTMLNGGGAREGMAKALAEITRKSAYFRKIEDDVQQYASSVLELKSALECFETDHMETLLEFHQRVEARLEQLTDESQVLARFEGFPSKKLGTIRMAAAIYSRLRSLLDQIERWRVEPPAYNQVEKITLFFNKFKVEVEAIERTKDDDSKHFATQNVYFSFDVITHIKEATVDLSSALSSLVLKESRERKTPNTKGTTVLSKDMKRMGPAFEMLWKAFDLSFRVYNFAGGHDENAHDLTTQLAKEMETYFQIRL
eukprot:c14414_g1_i1 orf=1010-3172(+)